MILSLSVVEEHSVIVHKWPTSKALQLLSTYRLCHEALSVLGTTLSIDNYVVVFEVGSWLCAGAEHNLSI